MSNRRGFLKCLAGGAVTGFPTIVPSTVFAQGGVAPSDRIGFGLIGVGRQGSGHVRGFLNHPDVQVRAICDANQANLERGVTTVNRRYNNNDCASIADFRQLLARTDIDAVMIATGERWHPLITIEAVRRGKHVYCEKPLGLSVAEGQAVRENVVRHGRVFQIGTQQRSSFNYRHAVELVRNGRIGQLKTIMIGSVRGPSNRLMEEPRPVPPGIDWDMWLGPSPWAPYSDMRISTAAWLFISDYGLGCLDGAWGIHDIDIAQWVADADSSGPIDVEATGTFYTDIRDVAQEYVCEHTYANGVKLIHMDMVTARKRAAEFNALPSTGATVIYGTEGWIFVSREGIRTKPEHLVREKFRPGEKRVIFSNDHRRNFLDAIRTGSQPIAGVEAAVRGLTVAQQEEIALRLARKLRWDPAKEQFIDDAAANRKLARAMRSPWHI
jgi:predicted dehydrogenase